MGKQPPAWATTIHAMASKHYFPMFQRHLGGCLWPAGDGFFPGNCTRLIEGQKKKNNLWAEYNEAVNINAIRQKDEHWRIRTTASSTAKYSDNTNARVNLDVSGLSMGDAGLLKKFRVTFAEAFFERVCWVSPVVER